MNTKDEGGENDNEDGLDVMDMLEEGKPTVDGMEGMAWILHCEGAQGGMCDIWIEKHCRCDILTTR